MVPGAEADAVKDGSFERGAESATSLHQPLIGGSGVTNYDLAVNSLNVAAALEGSGLRAFDRCITALVTAKTAPDRRAGDEGMPDSLYSLAIATVRRVIGAGHEDVIRKVFNADIPEWQHVEAILNTLGCQRNAPLFDYVRCLYLFETVPAALSHWCKGTDWLFRSPPDLRALRAWCAEYKRSIGKPGGWGRNPSASPLLPQVCKAIESIPGATLAEIQPGHSRGETAKADKERQGGESSPAASDSARKARIQERLARIRDEQRAARLRVASIGDMDDGDFATLRAAFIGRVKESRIDGDLQTVVANFISILHELHRPSEGEVTWVDRHYRASVVFAMRKACDQPGAFIGKVRELLQRKRRIEQSAAKPHAAVGPTKTFRDPGFAIDS